MMPATIPRRLITAGIVVLGIINIVVVMLVIYPSGMDLMTRGFITVWAVFGIIAMVRETLHWRDDTARRNGVIS